MFRKVLGAKSPPTEIEVGKPLTYRGGDVFAVIGANAALQGIGALIRPRQEAADLFPEALREGSEATPPFTPSVAPKLSEDPRALQGPVRRKAFGAEKDRQKRNDVKTNLA